MFSQCGSAQSSCLAVVDTRGERLPRLAKVVCLGLLFSSSSLGATTRSTKLNIKCAYLRKDTRNLSEPSHRRKRNERALRQPLFFFLQSKPREKNSLFRKRPKFLNADFAVSVDFSAKFCADGAAPCFRRNGYFGWRVALNFVAYSKSSMEC